jgi:hypothetical protein
MAGVGERLECILDIFRSCPGSIDAGTMAIQEGDTKMHRILSLLILATLSNPAIAAVAEISDPASAYLSVNVDRVVIDTDQLAVASARLAGAVDELAASIGRLSSEDSDLSDADRQALLRAVGSAEAASVALAELARKLPQSAENLGERLPGAIENARAVVAELSAGLQALRDSLDAISGSLPEAREHTRQLVDTALDAVLWRLSIFTLVLVAAVALALIGIMWFVYRQYLDPLARKLDALVGAPEHFDNMARHMQETSGNLLQLQAIGERSRRPDLRRRRNLVRRN